MSQPLITKYDYISHPKNHVNDYISRFPINFIGCMGCGNLDHQFRQCPQKKEFSSIFWLELQIHKLHTRRENKSPLTNQYLTSTSQVISTPRLTTPVPLQENITTQLLVQSNTNQITTTTPLTPPVILNSYSQFTLLPVTATSPKNTVVSPI